MKITIDEIAKLAKVSKATVSRVINNKEKGVSDETRARILKIIEQVGYKPNMMARGIVTSKTRTIGLIIPDITNPFFPELVRGVEDYANSKGYTVLLCNSDTNGEKESQYISTFIQKRVDGVLLSSNAPHQETYPELLNYEIPLVLLDRDLGGVESFPGVFLDNVKGAYLATKHLVRSGHRSIAFINGPISFYTSRDRLTGYRKALEENGIPFDRRLCVNGEYTMKSGAEAMDTLIKRKVEFSAVFAGNDLLAIGALKSLKKRGFLIPDDIEIIGFDNIDMVEIVEPSLSTVAQPIYQMAIRAARLLIDLIEGKKIKKKRYVYEPELILRQSTRSVFL